MRIKSASCIRVICLLLLSLAPFSSSGIEGLKNNSIQTVTLLFTNDFESAFDPIPAFWRDDIASLGGAAQLATMIEDIRKRETLVFLFDAGDIFTGILSKLTEGAVPMEMMITMGYDAMAIGNHEFEYGWESFAERKNRLPFPVLGANLFYKGTDIRYAQPYAVIERDGFRIGVIGLIGLDAKTAIIPSHVAGLDFRDPKTILPPLVRFLRPQVDLIVLLTHQGKTAPMQTDDEAHPEIKRDIDADIALAGAVQGIDVNFSGHADAGTEKPVVQPETGTLIMQTYGQGTRLGYLQLKFDRGRKKILSYKGALLPVISNRLEPDPIIAKKLAHYRSLFPELYTVVGHTRERMNRVYNAESDIGNLFSDILREKTQAQIAFLNAGGLRKDLPKGAVRLADVMDAFPFEDRIVTLQMTGRQIKAILEQSLTLERGMLQASGLTLHYDLNHPTGDRVLNVRVGGEPLHFNVSYRVATIEILAQGADLFKTFTEAKVLSNEGPAFADALQDYFKSHPVIDIPERGRLIPVK